MHPFIEAKLPMLRDICRRHDVARLELFGSATTAHFDATRSDLDFVLEYLPAARKRYPDVYFGLKAELEALFGRPVDLVMDKAIRNPYFREEVEATRIGLYAA